jgi:hypothetical protein
VYVYAIKEVKDQQISLRLPRRHHGEKNIHGVQYQNARSVQISSADWLLTYA